jgi:hypothetical protein
MLVADERSGLIEHMPSGPDAVRDVRSPVTGARPARYQWIFLIA